MTQQNPDGRLDLETLYLGIESCDPDLLLGFYADDAMLSIVNTDTQHVPPFELCGKGEIAKHLRTTFGQEATHRVERDASVGEDRVTYREVCRYPDGSRVWVETTLEVRDGKIVRQVDVVANAMRADRKGEIVRMATRPRIRPGPSVPPPVRPLRNKQATEKEDPV